MYIRKEYLSVKVFYKFSNQFKKKIHFEKLDLVYSN